MVRGVAYQWDDFAITVEDGCVFEISWADNEAVWHATDERIIHGLRSLMMATKGSAPRLLRPPPLRFTLIAQAL
jgi:hypothetical protein